MHCGGNIAPFENIVHNDRWQVLFRATVFFYVVVFLFFVCFVFFSVFVLHTSLYIHFTNVTLSKVFLFVSYY